MIEEGQVLYNKFSERICAITETYDDDEMEIFCSLIYQHGSVDNWVSEDEIKERFVLIAEYPTWKEAVNSREFNGEGVDIAKLKKKQNKKEEKTEEQKKFDKLFYSYDYTKILGEFE